MTDQSGALRAAEQSEPVTLPPIREPGLVRDARAGWVCDECGKQIPAEQTVTIHHGKTIYCDGCLNAENA